MLVPTILIKMRVRTFHCGGAPGYMKYSGSCNSEMIAATSPKIPVDRRRVVRFMSSYRPFGLKLRPLGVEGPRLSVVLACGAIRVRHAVRCFTFEGVSSAERFLSPCLSFVRGQVFQMRCNRPNEPERILYFSVAVTPKLVAYRKY